MVQTQVLRGLSTINFYAADHAAAKKWYSEFSGMEPYLPGIISNPHYLEIVQQKNK